MIRYKDVQKGVYQTIPIFGLKFGKEKITEYEYWSNGFHFFIIL